MTNDVDTYIPSNGEICNSDGKINSKVEVMQTVQDFLDIKNKKNVTLWDDNRYNSGAAVQAGLSSVNVFNDGDAGINQSFVECFKNNNCEVNECCEVIPTTCA